MPLLPSIILNFIFFAAISVVGQGLPVSDLLIAHNRTISPTFGDSVHAEIVPMTGMLLSRAS